LRAIGDFQLAVEYRHIPVIDIQAFKRIGDTPARRQLQGAEAGTVGYRQRLPLGGHLHHTIFQHQVAVDRQHIVARHIDPDFAVERALLQTPGIEIEQPRYRHQLQVRRIQVNHATVGADDRFDQNALPQLVG
jgi:hypothetical protein